MTERFKINGSLARAALKDLEQKGVIKLVHKHHAQQVYTRATKA